MRNTIDLAQRLTASAAAKATATCTAQGASEDGTVTVAFGEPIVDMNGEPVPEYDEDGNELATTVGNVTTIGTIGSVSAGSTVPMVGSLAIGAVGGGDDAAKTATNYMQFTDGTGLVVGDMTGETLGGNVLIDSDSVDIRQGTKTMATFYANGEYQRGIILPPDYGSSSLKMYIDEDIGFPAVVGSSSLQIVATGVPDEATGIPDGGSNIWLSPIGIGFYANGIPCLGLENLGDGKATISLPRAPWRDALGIHSGATGIITTPGAAQTLTTSASEVQFANAAVIGSGGFTKSGYGLVCPYDGTVHVDGTISFGTGYTANDIVHLMVYVNGSGTFADGRRIVPDSAHRKVSTGYGTMDVNGDIEVKAGDVLTLMAYNQTGARGTIAANSDTRLQATYY